MAVQPPRRQAAAPRPQTSAAPSSASLLIRSPARLQVTLGNQAVLRLQQRMAAGEARAAPDGVRHPSLPSVVEAVLRSHGQPLDDLTRTDFERRLGQDFANVRIHTGTDAARAAAAINARAYTVGRDIVFGAEQFAPRSAMGRGTLAHELVHVVQQGGTKQRGAIATGPITVEPATSAGEREADVVTRAALAGDRATAPRPALPIGEAPSGGRRLQRLVWSAEIERRFEQMRDTPVVVEGRLGQRVSHTYRFDAGDRVPPSGADQIEFTQGVRYNRTWMSSAVGNDASAQRSDPTIADMADTGLSEQDARSLLLATSHEGGYNTINTYDTAGVTLGFEQTTIASGNLQRVIAVLQAEDPNAYAELFTAFGITLWPNDPQSRRATGPLELRALSPAPPHELLTQGASVSLFRSDPRYAAIFIRAGQHPSMQRAQRLHAARSARGALAAPIRGLETIARGDVLTGLRGRALVMDRRIQRPGDLAIIDQVIVAEYERLTAAGQLHALSELATHEAELLRAVVARFDAELAAANQGLATAAQPLPATASPAERAHQTRDVQHFTGLVDRWRMAVRRTRDITERPDAHLPQGSFPTSAPASASAPASVARPTSSAVESLPAPAAATTVVAAPAASVTVAPAAPTPQPAPAAPTPPRVALATQPVAAAPQPPSATPADPFRLSGPVGPDPALAGTVFPGRRDLADAQWNAPTSLAALASALRTLRLLAPGDHAPALPDLVAAVRRFQLQSGILREADARLGWVIPGLSTELRLRQAVAATQVAATGASASTAAPSDHPVVAAGSSTGTPEAGTGTSNSHPNADGIAQRLGARSYADYIANHLVTGRVFGVPLVRHHGVHPRLFAKLQGASDEAALALGGRPLLVHVISGQDQREGYHAFGLAIDIDYAENPYLSHEAGEQGERPSQPPGGQTMDMRVHPILDRISVLMLGVRSVYTRGLPFQASRGASGRVAQPDYLYDELARESDAMADYFRITGLRVGHTRWDQPADGQRRLVESVHGPESLEAMLRSLRTQPRDWALAGLAGLDLSTDAGLASAAARIRAQAQLDRAVLRGIDQPHWRNAFRSGAVDYPFEGASAARDPVFGTMSLQREAVVALRRQGLRWGAIDFAHGSGDVMHFDDGNTIAREQRGDPERLLPAEYRVGPPPLRRE